MATVFLATDLKHRREVAIKVLRPEIAAALGATRFLREIEIAAGLVHPHILGLHDSGESEGLLFFVMPYVDGESLRDRLKRERRLPVTEAVRVVRDIADALTHAHARGVLHRDVKPENILFEAGHAIISDFGVARAVTAAGGDAVTQTGVVVGTPAYMSPEQALGDKELDGRSDVYSLGCVTFEMLTGEPAFPGATPSALARKMLNEPAKLRTTVQAVPEEVERVVAKAISRDPAERHASPKEFADALEVAASRPYRATTGFGTWQDQRRRVRIGIVAAVLVVGVALWGARSAGDAPITSLAVLPFNSVGGDSLPPYVVDGIHDEIIGELGRINALKRVISRTSVMRYRNPLQTIEQIAADLHVDAIVEAALYRTGDSVRIQMRLVRAQPEERQVWAHTYETDTRSLRSLHADVARDIANKLRVALIPAEGASIGQLAGADGGGSTTNRQAYDAYLLGKYWLNKRTPEGMATAEAQLRRAISLDSNFAAAHAALASTLALVNDWHYKQIDPIAVSREAISEANRALALDSLSGEAWAARGRILSAGQAPEEVVRRDFERAIRAAPHHANAHGWYAMELAWRGHAAESRAENVKAIALDPTSPGRHMGLAISSISIGDFDVALAEGKRIVELEPSITLTRYVDGLALISLGRFEECLSLRWDRYPSIRAMCMHASGRVREARQLIDSVEARAVRAINRGGPYSDILIGDNLAYYYAYVGDVDRALRWTRFSFTLTTAAPLTLVYGPVFDRVRNDPRFAAGLRKIRDDTWRRLNTPPLKLD